MFGLRNQGPVLVNGNVVAPCDSDVGCNTWVFEQSGGQTTIRFEGAACDALDNATVLSGVTLTFKIQQ